MTSQEKKEYLQTAFQLEKRIETLLKEKSNLQELKARCCSTTANYENDGSQNGSHQNGTENKFITYVDKLTEYEAELDKLVEKLIDTKRHIKQIITLVPKYEQREVLMKRYINYDKWEQIAVDMRYDIRHIYRLHGEALENVKI